MAIFKTLVTKIPIPNDKKIKQKSYLQMENLAIIDQGLSFIGGYTNDTSYQLDFDLPVIVFGDHTCCVKYLTFPFAAGADGIKVLKPCINVLPKYLYYGTQYLVLCLPDRGYARHYQHIEKMELPVPPIAEQQRIVTRIEELFSELDSAVETLQKTKQQLSVYRKSVLQDAFLGEYPRKKLSEFSKAFGGYAFKSKLYTDEGHYVVVKIGNVKSQKFDFTRDFTKTDEISEKILEKYLLLQGDCLITLTGTRGKRDYGFVAMIKDEKNYLLNQRVAAIRFNKDVAIPEFYQYYLSSPVFRDLFFTYETGNVGQGNVGMKALLEPEVILPSIEEQKRIINIIENRMSVCDNLDQTVASALLQAEAMRQSILKKAFEGRL